MAFFTLEHAAETAFVTLSFLQNEISAGHVKPVKIDGELHIDGDEILRWLERRNGKIRKHWLEVHADGITWNGVSEEAIPRRV